jgi:hypothetical protein
MPKAKLEDIQSVHDDDRKGSDVMTKVTVRAVWDVHCTA